MSFAVYGSFTFLDRGTYTDVGNADIGFAVYMATASVNSKSGYGVTFRKYLIYSGDTYCSAKLFAFGNGQIYGEGMS